MQVSQAVLSPPKEEHLNKYITNPSQSIHKHHQERTSGQYKNISLLTKIYSNGRISKILTDYVQKTKENEENNINNFKSPKRTNKKALTM